MKAGDEVGDRGFPGAAAADQRGHRSAGHDDAEVADHRPAFTILELDGVEADLAYFEGGVDRVGAVGLIVLHPEDLEDALHGGE